MTSTTPAVQPETVPAAIASWRHMVGLLLILAVLTAYGLHLQHAAKGPQIAISRQDLIGTYIGVIVSEWALAFYCWRGIRKRVRVAEIVGERWNDSRKLLAGLLVSAAFWVVWESVAWLANQVVGPNHAKSISVLLPRSTAEIALWIAVSCSAGMCEEFVFRGYLQRQLWALSKTAWVAIAAQAVIFGVSHGYQGAQKMIVISVLGALYGMLAHWKRNLRPGMLAHAWSDIYGGLF